MIFKIARQYLVRSNGIIRYWCSKNINNIETSYVADEPIEVDEKYEEMFIGNKHLLNSNKSIAN